MFASFQYQGDLKNREYVFRKFQFVHLKYPYIEIPHDILQILFQYQYLFYLMMCWNAIKYTAIKVQA